MKQSYGKYINTFSFYVTVIQYKSDFNVCSVTYKHQNLQICSSLLLNKKRRISCGSGALSLRFFHNPLPLFKIYTICFTMQLQGFCQASNGTFSTIIYEKFLSNPLPQDFVFCAKSTYLVAKLQGILFWHKLYFSK